MERWYSFSSYCKKTYGHRLYRVPLDGGFTCPNRDGTKGTRGCIFCSGRGSGEFAIAYTGQRLNEEDLIYNRTHGCKGQYIGYFQAFTSTYGPLDKLRKLYVSVLENPLFAGIDIATRPDCVGPDVIGLLQQLKEKYPQKVFFVELGFQTCHEKTAEFIRRGYDNETFVLAVKDLRRCGMDVIVHVILGLPYENEEMMLETTRQAVAAGTDGIKFQLLHVLRGTDLAKDYLEGKFRCLELEEYTAILKKCIALLPPRITVHRITGDGAKRDLIAPLWSADKKRVLNTLNRILSDSCD